MAAASAIKRSVDTASQGYKATKFGCAVVMAKSSSAICDGPSSPIDTPACDPTSLTLTLLIAAMRTKSAARVRKQPEQEQLRDDGTGDACNDRYPIMTIGLMLDEERRSAESEADQEDVQSK